MSRVTTDAIMFVGPLTAATYAVSGSAATWWPTSSRWAGATVIQIDAKVANPSASIARSTST